MNNYIETAIKEMVKKEEEVIVNSFRKHFGFSIAEVNDKENLERVITEGKSEEEFRYRGETFLIIDRTPDFEKKNGEYTITMNIKEV